MNILSLDEIQKTDYSYKYLYDNPLFHIVNGNKVDEVFCCVFGGKKARAGIIGGIDGEIIKIPYSSPFAMLESFKNNTIADIDSYIEELDNYAREKQIKTIYFKLPPMFYDETNISKFISALLRAGYNIHRMELNYQLFLRSQEKYMQSLYKNAKKNLNHALAANFKMEYCKNEKEKKIAYEIIKINRANKGYSLSMTWDDVKDTIEIAEHDFFVLNRQDKPTASAIIFKVTDDIYQVIYWGDIPGYSEDRPINYLAYALCNYYFEKGIRVLDIGPSMMEGHPNYGLCDFKESIGCDVSSKFILKKDIVV